MLYGTIYRIIIGGLLSRSVTCTQHLQSHNPFAYFIIFHPHVPPRQSTGNISERLHVDIRVYDVHNVAGSAARSSAGRNPVVGDAHVHERVPNEWRDMATGERNRAH